MTFSPFPRDSLPLAVSTVNPSKNIRCGFIRSTVSVLLQTIPVYHANGRLGFSRSTLNTLTRNSLLTSMFAIGHSKGNRSVLSSSIIDRDCRSASMIRMSECPRVLRLAVCESEWLLFARPLPNKPNGSCFMGLLFSDTGACPPRSLDQCAPGERW